MTKWTIVIALLTCGVWVFLMSSPYVPPLEGEIQAMNHAALLDK